MTIERLQNVWPGWKVSPEPIGRGSFGTVYRAEHTEQGIAMHAAIKVISIPGSRYEIDSLRAEGFDDASTHAHFQSLVEEVVNEIRLMQRLKDVPNVVNIEDFRVLEREDHYGGDIIIRMELLKPLTEYGTLSEDDVIRMGIDISSALVACEAEGIIHRDIKPENIFVSEHGYFKLGDFGIARKMEMASISMTRNTGTYNYMAPEVTIRGNYDVRADLYSLGLVLYKCLNNNLLPFYDPHKQLFRPEERYACLTRRLNGEPLPPPCNASPEMAELILRACAYDPEGRFPNAREMKKALESVRAGTSVRAGADLGATKSVRKPDEAPPLRDEPHTENLPPTDERGRREERRKDKPVKRGDKNKILPVLIALLCTALLGFGVFTVSQQLKHVRPVEAVDDAAQFPADENGDAQLPADENGDAQFPANENGDAQPTADENGDAQLPADENDAAQLPADENDTAQLPADENGDDAAKVMEAILKEDRASGENGDGAESEDDVTVTEPVLDFIAVKTGPTKTSYFVGDTLDKTGLTLTATYSNGKTETVTSGFTCAPTSLETAGTQSVTVTYGGKKTVFDVNVAAVTLKSVAVKSNPKKTDYFVGDTLDQTGLTLTAIYSNGKTETVASGFTCAPTSLGTAGTQSITVTYSGKKTTFNVNVAAVTLKSVAVKSNPKKTSYFVGDTLDQTGLTLTAVYSNGKTETVTSGFTCTPASLGTAGTQSVTVTYSGKKTTFNVNVAAVTLSSVAVKTNPTKTNYNVGDTLDQTGLTLTATYSNGKTETVTSGFTYWPVTLDTAGTQTVYVTYNEKTASFSVNAAAVTLSSIAVRTNPTKTSYNVGDTLDTSGLTLTATYSNGKTETVTSGFTYWPTSLGTAGTQTVTVSYGGATTTFNVTVSGSPLRIVKSPQSVTLKSVTDTVTFNVEITGGKAPYIYKWFAVKDTGTVDTKSVTSDKTTCAYLYTFDKTTFEIAKTFYVYCLVTDSEGMTAESEKAAVTKAPKVAGVKISLSSFEMNKRDDGSPVVSVTLGADLPPEARDIEWSFSNITPSVLCYTSLDVDYHSLPTSYLVMDGDAFSDIRAINFEMFQYGPTLAKTGLHEVATRLNDYIYDESITTYYVTVTLNYVVRGVTYESEWKMFQDVK